MTQATSIRSATDLDLTIPVDPDPSSLRTALLVILLIASVVGYVIAQLLTSPEAACSPLALIIGVASGAGVMRASEWFLRPRWKSNKHVTLSPTELAIQIKGEKQHQVDPSQPVEVHLWYFRVKRATRVPKGWHVVGLGIEESGYILPVYCLVSPEQFADMPRSADFTELLSRKSGETEGRGSLRAIGQQRRLLRAEGARDLHGVEMTYDNFVMYMEWIAVHFPEWLPVS